MIQWLERHLAPIQDDAAHDHPRSLFPGKRVRYHPGIGRPNRCLPLQRAITATTSKSGRSGKEIALANREQSRGVLSSASWRGCAPPPPPAPGKSKARIERFYEIKSASPHPTGGGSLEPASLNPHRLGGKIVELHIRSAQGFGDRALFAGGVTHHFKRFRAHRDRRSQSGPESPRCSTL